MTTADKTHEEDIVTGVLRDIAAAERAIAEARAERERQQRRLEQLSKLEEAAMEHVWHYFNEAESDCWFKNPCLVPGKKEPVTLCGSRIRETTKHTENKDGVTCRTCFHRIVEMDRCR